MQARGTLLALKAEGCRRAGRVCQLLCDRCLRQGGLPDKHLAAFAVIAGKQRGHSRQDCMAVYVHTEWMQHAGGCLTSFARQSKDHSWQMGAALLRADS